MQSNIRICGGKRKHPGAENNVRTNRINSTIFVYNLIKVEGPSRRRRRRRRNKKPILYYIFE